MAIFCPEKYRLKEFKNLNQEFFKLEGTLEDKIAKVTLVNFLRANLGLTCKLLTGFELTTYQEILLKGWFNRNFSMLIAGRGCGKCIDYEGFIYLVEKNIGMGLVKDLIKNIDFSNGEKWVDIPELELWNGKSWQKTNKVLIQPQKESIKLFTKRGFEISGSINHRIKILDKENCRIVWKQLNEIQKGDYVCISRNPTEWGQNGDTNEAYLIGLLLGDGCFRDKYLNITNMDEEILQFVEKFPHGIRVEKDNCKAVRIGIKKEFSNFLREKYSLGFDKSYTKKIPNIIFQSRETLKSCIQGIMDTDGYIEKGGRIGIGLTSINLIKQLQYALLTFGIISYWKERKTSSPFGKVWVLNITGEEARKFQSKIDFRLSTKKQRLKNHLDKNFIFNTNIDVVPGAIKSGVKIRKKLRKVDTNSPWKKFVGMRKNRKSISYNKLNEMMFALNDLGAVCEDYYNLLEIEKENFFFDEVDKITSYKANCIDFNIPDGEMYWANGFINHNSTLAAIFCILYPIFNPGTKIIIAGPTFRTARHIFNELMKQVNAEEALLVKQAFNASSEDGEPHRRTDIYQWAINEGEIIAIPLSGDKIRGFRATVLILDETLLLTDEIIDKVLMPFLVANANTKQRLKVARREKVLIKKGIITEDERIVFDNNTKMICLSSASYTFENLFRRYTKWMDNVFSEEISEATYFTAQVSYEAVPKEIISDTIIKEAEALGRSHPLFLREYCAQFTDGTDGYFSAKKMAECSLKPGEQPNLTLKGDPHKKYILSIDPNANQSKVADDFAMCVTEYNNNGYGTVVHQYANHEADLKANVEYFYYLITNFNIVFVILDLAGGRKFIEACNLSEHFKKNKIEMKFIEFDTNKEEEDYVKEIINARNQYNLLDRKICIEQHFNTDWIRKANEYLQTNINYKRIWFGSKIRPDGIIFDSVAGQDIADVSLMGFPGKSREDIIGEAIDEQDILIQLVKDECTLIEVTTNAQGSQSFDIPQNLRRDKSAKRARKDSYTALKLANWAAKCYFDLMSYKPRAVQNTFTPTVIAQLD